MKLKFDDQVGGSVTSRLLDTGMDPLALRPWKGKDGGSYIARNVGTPETPKLESVRVQNVSGLLRKDDWLVLDRAVVKTAKARLKAVADLRQEGMQFNIPDGLGRTSFMRERQSDINEAMISMDGIRQSQDDRPEFDAQQIPLPIIHKDFQFSARQLAASRNGGSPLDTTTAELAARRVAEQAEALLLGTAAAYAYAGGTIYGYTNFPSRIAQAMTNPTATGWVPSVTLKEVLLMRKRAQTARHYGPYLLYNSLDWDEYLDNDYKNDSSGSSTTLRERILGIKSIKDVRTLDYLPPQTMILLQLSADVARMVVGMDITTVQWETHGGMLIHFKVMCILVPDLRADFYGNCGIVHGSYT